MKLSYEPKCSRHSETNEVSEESPHRFILQLYFEKI